MWRFRIDVVLFWLALTALSPVWVSDRFAPGEGIFGVLLDWFALSFVTLPAGLFIAEGLQWVARRLSKRSPGAFE